MDRRLFLSTALGAAAFGGGAFPAGASQDGGGDGWNTDPPTTCANPTNPDPCPPTYAAPDDILAAVPRPGDTMGSFAYPVGSPVERPLWSQVIASNNQRLIGQIRDAYREIRQRDPKDPTSLYFQARLHEYYCSRWDKGNVHRTWDFLPWHRGFIYFHEQILKATQAVHDDPTFRLPVWDWEKDSHIPPVFKDLGLPTFLDGPYGRTPYPTGTWVSPCILQAWLLSQRFEDFCGYQVCTTDDCARGRSAGGPHNTVHNLIVGGAMSEPHTSAADPTFYTHHANVDRFWAYWLKRYKYNVPANLPSGWGNQTFHFYDKSKKLIPVKTSQLLDHEKLGYKYAPTDVPLCDFDSEPIVIAEQFLANSFGLLLRAKLEAFAVGAFLATTAELKSMVGFVKDLRSGQVNLESLLNPACWMALPLQIAARLPTDQIQAGKYYLVQLTSKQGGSFNLAGFGIFASPHHLQMAPSIEVAIAGCISPGVWTALLNPQTDWQLVYVESSDGENATGLPKDLVSATMNILYPKGLLGAGRSWLQKFLW